MSILELTYREPRWSQCVSDPELQGPHLVHLPGGGELGAGVLQQLELLGLGLAVGLQQPQLLLAVGQGPAQLTNPLLRRAEQRLQPGRGNTQT